MGSYVTNLDVAERVASIFAEQGVSCLVIGAVAMAAHRYVRYTEDIDLGTDADLKTMRAVADLLSREGYDVEIHEPDAEDPLGGVMNISGPFGLVQVVSFADRFPRVIHDALEAEDVRIRPGTELRLVPIAQLVAMKLYAGGHASMSDVIELLRRNPEANIEAIRATCRKYRLRGFDAVLKELEPEAPDT